MQLSSLLVSYTEYFKDENGDKHYDYPDVWTSFAKDSLSRVFLFSAIALAVILLAIALVLKFKKPEALKNFGRVAVSLVVGFSATVIIAMLALEFLDMVESEAVFGLVLYPAIVFGGSLILGGAAVYTCSLISEKARKISIITALSVCGAALVALFVCLAVYFATGDAEENNGVTITMTENAVLYVGTAVLLGTLLFIAFFFGRRDKKGFDSKSISYAAVCIAMSFALSYLKLWRMPQGGSVTAASLLPLMVYAFMFGPKKGIFAGFIYGALQAMQDPWIVHPAQFLLDYPVAFAGIGAAGMFYNVKKLEKLPQIQFALGAIVAGILRYAAHLFSGVFAFSEYAEGNPWIYSLAYNSFVFVDIAIVIAVGIFVFSSRSFLKEVQKFRTKTSVPKKEEPEPLSEDNA